MSASERKVLERRPLGRTGEELSVIGFGGVQLLLLGIVGEYLGRIYCETKRRPLYLVKDTDGQAGAPVGEAVGEAGTGRPLAARAS